MVNLSEKEFYDKFNCIDNMFDDNASFSGKMFETYGKELEFVLSKIDTNQVITILECDTDIYNEEEDYYESAIVYSTGYHLVNRMGYFILEKPYEYEFEVITD